VDRLGRRVSDGAGWECLWWFLRPALVALCEWCLNKLNLSDKPLGSALNQRPVRVSTADGCVSVTR
jgi:hypothetical protein